MCDVHNQLWGSSVKVGVAITHRATQDIDILKYIQRRMRYLPRHGIFHDLSQSRLYLFQ